MLSNFEKIIFIILALSSLSVSYITFGKMFRVIMTGTQPLVWSQIFKNWKFGFAAFFGQNTLFKTRPLVGFIHALVAWGFSLYLAVNVIDVVYGFVPNFKFLPESLIGDGYRLFVDIFSVLVLLGVFYFLLRLYPKEH